MLHLGIVFSGTWNMSEKKYPKKKNLKTYTKWHHDPWESYPNNHVQSQKKHSGELCLANPKIAEKKEMKVGKTYSQYSIYIYILYIYT